VAQDPYGYSVEDGGQPAPSSGGWFAGISTLAWLGAALFVCCGCSAILPFGDPQPGDQWYDRVGVWMLLVSPASILAGIAFATAFLHGVARRWWTAAGPNVVIGGCGGCLVLLVFFIGWVMFAVVMDG
jgi:hypothetical protein